MTKSRTNKLGHLSFLEKRILRDGIRRLAGVDEAGRGCLAGPVVAACVLISPKQALPTVADSKVLSPRHREALLEQICQRALAWSVAMVAPAEIDQINIHQASLKAMRLAVEQLSLSPDYLLVDGRFPLAVTLPQQAVVHGDARCQVIAAASILAKVWRDRHMAELAARYPHFTFQQHKGYPTRRHRTELDRHGPTELHRRSFRGVS